MGQRRKVHKEKISIPSQRLGTSEGVRKEKLVTREECRKEKIEGG